MSLRDIPATILDLLGEKQGAIPGESMGRLLREVEDDTELREKRLVLSELEDGTFWPSQYPTSKGPMKSLVGEKFRYIWNGDGSEELYDRISDPYELNNIVKEDENSAVLGEFRSALKSTFGAIE